MNLIYLDNADYDATVSRLTAILNVSKPTLQFNLATALWCARIEGGRLLDPVWTDERQGHTLITALASMDPDPATGDFSRDQIQWTLWDAGIFPARARVQDAA